MNHLKSNAERLDDIVEIVRSAEKALDQLLYDRELEDKHKLANTIHALTEIRLSVEETCRREAMRLIREKE